jgi:hypothetical protein
VDWDCARLPVLESIIAMKRKRKRWKALLLTLDLTLIKNSKENRYENHQS